MGPRAHSPRRGQRQCRGREFAGVGGSGGAEASGVSAGSAAARAALRRGAHASGPGPAIAPALAGCAGRAGIPAPVQGPRGGQLTLI